MARFKAHESPHYKFHPTVVIDHLKRVTMAQPPGTKLEIAGRRFVRTTRGPLVRISAKRSATIPVPVKDKKGKFERNEKGIVTVLETRHAVDVPRNGFFARHFYPEFHEKN